MLGNPTRLSVLEAITPSRIGGAETFVVELCARFPELGADVTLFCPSGRRFVEFAASRGHTPVTWGTTGKLDPLTVIRLAKLIRSRGIDVVHTHLSTASLLGAFAARLAGRRSVAHVHGLNTATCFRWSHGIIAVSHAVKSHLVGQGIDPDKVRVVHNGVDVSRFSPALQAEARERLGWDPAQFVFGVFGRLSPEKGQLVAMEATYLLVKEKRVSARLVFVGDGQMRADLERLAEAMGIADAVTFTGFAPDVRDMMSACDAVVVPSLKEGFGLAAVEAMALGRPVVASDVGGLPEIVVPDETGFLASPGDPKALAQAMIELVTNPDHANAMGKQGRERVEQRFDSTKQLGEVLEVLRGYAP